MIFCLLLSLLIRNVWAVRTDALQTIFHDLQKSLDAGMESYIVQLEFSAAFDRVSHSGLLFKLKSIGVGNSVLSICRDFLSNRRQRVVVDVATSEWIPIVSGVPQESGLDPLLFILHTSEMFEQVDNRLYAYADDSTLMAVVRKPADRPTVAASLNRDVPRIQEWCNHWCMMLNPNKTKALIVSRSRTVNSPFGNLVLFGDSIPASPNLDILDVKFDSKFTFEDHVRGIVSRVSQRIVILRLVKRKFVDTSVLLPWVVTILHLFSQSLSIFLRCGGQLLNVIFSFVSARLFGGRALLSLSFLLYHRRRVAGLSMLYKVNVNSNRCLFSELPSAATRVRHSRAASTAHPLEFEVSRCRTSQFVRCFLPAQIRMWNDLPCTVFDTRTLDGFYCAVNR